MIFIHTLRMIAELSVYFFIADLFAVSLGGFSQLISMLLLAFCYGILVYLQTRSFHKIYLLLPILVLLLPQSYPLALLPPIIYIFYLIWNKNTALSWDRHSELFSASIKFFLIVGPCICLSGNFTSFIKYSLPMIFLFLATSVILLRMLRHDSATYLNPHYQRKNAFTFLIVLFLAWIFSRDFVFTFIADSLAFIYMNGIYPILCILITCFVAILRLFIQLFAWLNIGDIRLEENLLPESGGTSAIEEVHIAMGEHVGSVRSILTFFAIIILLTIAFFFFRWLFLHKGRDSFVNQGIIIALKNNDQRQKKERNTTIALQIRHQYRIFLKRYKAHGGKLEETFTSEDVLQQASNLLINKPVTLLEEMREIYLNARYRGTATKSDLKRIKRINKELAQS